MAAPLELGPATEELDLEALVAEFLVDESRATLEMPRMSASQRKQAKRLVEQHPGLRCESFGFGQDRQLHLFKEAGCGTAAAAAASSPSPKATAASAAAGGASPARTGAEQHWETSEACSTAASTPGSPSSSPRSAQLRQLNIGKPPGLATPLGNATVRNTFIHFESSKQDDRQVQSMPHGMFRQQLWAEALSESVAEQALMSPTLSFAAEGPEAEPTTAVEQLELSEAAAVGDQLPPGVEVEISGLTKCPAFNGRRAVVQSYDQETERYDITLWCNGGEQKAKVRRENLGRVTPLSPDAESFSPQVTLSPISREYLSRGGALLASPAPREHLAYAAPPPSSPPYQGSLLASSAALSHAEPILATPSPSGRHVHAR